MKKQTFNPELIDELTLYTGTNGKSGCSCNCPGCSQTNYGIEKINNFNQGTITQITQIIKLLPNLKKAYILGNPDCNVDTLFCSEAAKIFIENGIHVMFSTSGIGGDNTIKKLLTGIDLKFVDYVSFSIDSIYPNVESLLKGRNVNYQTLLKGIEYCKSINVPVKIQPTIWQINQNSCIDLIEFFYYTYQITWFTFHVGSMEGFYPQTHKACKHVLPEQWHTKAKEIIRYSQKENIKVSVPAIFLNEYEYKEYRAKYLPHCVNDNPTNLQVYMENTLKATFYPILSIVYPKYFTFPLSEDMVCYKPTSNNNLCIVQNRSLGNELAQNFTQNKYTKDEKTFFYVCRYYKFN